MDRNIGFYDALFDRSVPAARLHRIPALRVCSLGVSVPRDVSEYSVSLGSNDKRRSVTGFECNGDVSPTILTTVCRSGTIGSSMHSKTSKDNTRYGWLKAIGAGVILIAVGWLRLAGDVQVVTHGTGQPMFSWGLIAGGIVCILSALIPSSWIPKAAGTTTRKKAR